MILCNSIIQKEYGKLKKTSGMGSQTSLKIWKSKKSYRTGTISHLQLSAESLDKPLLKCHWCISLEPQINVYFENVQFSK